MVSIRGVEPSIVRGLLLTTLTVGMIAGAVSPASSQGFISPMFGVNIGGVSGCPQLNNCTDQQTNISVAAGKFGAIFGAEMEGAYAPEFFGEAAGLSSNVLTLMGNVMLAPRVGPLRPYLVAGTGLMKTRFELRTLRLTTDDTMLGYNVGGGVVALLTGHFGVRADLRYFHSFPDVTIAGFSLASDKLNYSRASAGLIVAF